MGTATSPQLTVSSGGMLKHYEVPEPSLLAAFDSTTLAITGVKVAVIQAAMIAFVSHEPKWSQPKFGNKVGALYAMAVAKDVTIQTTKLALQRFSVRLVVLGHLSERAASKLAKDVSKSAVRKVGRAAGTKGPAAARMVKTGMRSGFLGHAAIFTVEQSVLTFVFVRNRGERPKYPTVHEKLDAQDEDRLFLLLTLSNLGKFAGSVVLGGVGAAIGTLVKPGLGTYVGQLLGDSILYLV